MDLLTGERNYLKYSYFRRYNISVEEFSQYSYKTLQSIPRTAKKDRKISTFGTGVFLDTSMPTALISVY